jgi:uncharacterized membrane protein YedE/YeeE
MREFTPVAALIGGSLIGLASALLLLTHGRVAGVSGVFGGLVRREGSPRDFRGAFLLGLLLGGAALRWIAPSVFASTWQPSLPVALVAGLLVGVGTQVGNGCTSGHGVCGISRGSARSIVATVTFMATGFATVYVTRHVLGRVG